MVLKRFLYCVSRLPSRNVLGRRAALASWSCQFEINHNSGAALKAIWPDARIVPQAAPWLRVLIWRSSSLRCTGGAGTPPVRHLARICEGSANCSSRRVIMRSTAFSHCKCEPRHRRRRGSVSKIETPCSKWDFVHSGFVASLVWAEALEAALDVSVATHP